MGTFGTGIKSIQRDLVSVAPGNTDTISISSVDTSKSMVLVSTKNGYSNGTNAGGGYSTSVSASVELTDSTTLTWRSGSGFVATGNVNAEISWQVIEYF